MRIAHLSDIHLNTVYKKSNISKTKGLIELALKKGFDHLVITGDISDNSEEKDFLIFRKILKSFDLLDSAKTTIVIGNHDIFGGVNTAQDVVKFPSNCLRIDYDKKIKQFTEYFKELFEGCYLPEKDSTFPFVKVIRDIAFIGINTIDRYSRIKNPFASNGKVYQKQLSALKEIFSNSDYQGKRKIILSHHHYYKNAEEAVGSSSMWNKIESYTLKLRGKKKLLKLFSDNNVELVLHGHSHEIREYRRKGIHFINAGGSVDNAFTEKAAILLIDVKEKINTTVLSPSDRLRLNSSHTMEKEYVHTLAV